MTATIEAVPERTSWLDELAGTLVCASCGAPYRRDDLQVSRRLFERWLVRCECHVCGSEGMAVVVVEGPGRRVSTFGGGSSPFTADDVLDAHDALRDHVGPFRALLGGDDR